MMTYLLQVTLCLACFYGFYHFALRKETLFGTNRVYLLTTLLVSMILPLIKIYVDSRMASTSFITAPAVYVGSYLDTLAGNVVIAPIEDSFDWGRVVAGLYLLGIALLSIRMGKALWEIGHIRRTGTPLDIQGRSCILSDKVQAPFSFFSAIYLPRDHAFGPHELREVLSHEAAHIRARHTWDVLLMEAACILMWPNPFVYLYRKSLREIHEYAADAEVIKDTPWEAYAQLLVAQQHHHLQNLLSNQFYSQLKKRLHMMNQKPSAATARLKYLGIVPVLLLALVAFSFREKQDNRPEIQVPQLEPQPSTLPEQSFSLYSDGLKIHTTLDGRSSKNPESMMPASAARLSQDGDPDMPVFPGCEGVTKADLSSCSASKMMEYIVKHLQYPEALRKSGLQGKVLVRFIVGSDGLIQKPEVIKSLSPDADQAALDLVNGMNEKAGKWQPARKDGKAVDTELVLPITFALTAEGEEEPYTYVEEMPSFPEGTEAMYKYIYDKITYPAIARENGISGQVIVQFVVSKDGDIRNAKVLRGIGGGCDEEALRVVSSMPKWKPGRHNGRQVPVTFTLPIKFVLQDKVQKQERADEDKPESPVNHLTALPNPASSAITVETFSGAHTIQIFDAHGKAVLTWEVDPGVLRHDIDVSRLPPGQYVIKAQSKDASAAVNLSIIR